MVAPVKGLPRKKPENQPVIVPQIEDKTSAILPSKVLFRSDFAWVLKFSRLSLILSLVELILLVAVAIACSALFTVSVMAGINESVVEATV